MDALLAIILSPTISPLVFTAIGAAISWFLKKNPIPDKYRPVIDEILKRLLAREAAVKQAEAHATIESLVPGLMQMQAQALAPAPSVTFATSAPPSPSVSLSPK